MIRGFALAASFVLIAGAAQADVIKDRQAAMKAMSAAAKPSVAILKGAPFDAAAVKKTLAALSANAKKSVSLYPAGSGKGKTAALPAIWEKKADFDAKMNKLAADADAAMAKITNAASFKAEFPKVMANCGACHKPYRAKKN